MMKKGVFITYRYIIVDCRDGIHAAFSAWRLYAAVIYLAGLGWLFGAENPLPAELERQARNASVEVKREPVGRPYRPETAAAVLKILNQRPVDFPVLEYGFSAASRLLDQYSEVRSSVVATARDGQAAPRLVVAALQSLATLNEPGPEVKAAATAASRRAEPEVNAAAEQLLINR